MTEDASAGTPSPQPPDGASPGPAGEDGTRSEVVDAQAAAENGARGWERGLMGRLVRRPVTVLMLFTTLIGTGVMAYLRIPLTLLPEGFSEPELSIRLPYPGAGPVEVHDQLTRPVEDALRTLPGITEIESRSREDRSDIDVTFSANVDMDLAYAEVRERIERIRPELPPEMDRFRIFRFKSDSLPILWMGVQYDEDADDPFAPLEKIVVPRLEGVDGVASVGTWGIVDEAVRIFVDVERVKGYGVDLGALIQRLQADNFTLPAGVVDDGGREFAVRVDARFRSVDEIRQYPVPGGLVLDDIADIELAKGYRDRVWRINGRGAVGISVSKESSENTIAVCDRVDALIEELADDPRLAGVDFNIFFSQKEMIVDSIGALQSSGLWGGLFAVIVLWSFLRDLRMTILAALAIPASLLTAVVAVYFSGMSLNIISLTGFTLGIGMLVDNAVVVVENIVRKRGFGLGPLASAASGAGEVGVAVVTATLTSICVFLPLVFMADAGEMRVVMAQIGLPITYSLLASLTVAMIFIPMFASRLLGARRGAKATAGVPGLGTDDGRLKRGYRAALERVLEHRLAATIGVVFLLGAAGALGSQLRAAREGGDGGGGLRVDVEAPPQYSLSEVNEVFRRLESWAEENGEEQGFEYYNSSFGRRGGSFNIWPERDLEPERIEALTEWVRASLPVMPGVEYRVGRDEAGDEKRVRYEFTGRESRVLAQITETVKQRLESLTFVDDDGTVRPLLQNVESDLDRGLDELRVRIDRERASDLGVAPESIRGMVAWGLGGQRLPDLARGETDVRVQIEYALQEEENLRFLENLVLGRDVGGTVPLRSVADITFEKSLGDIRRHNGRTSMGVTAEAVPDHLYLVAREIEAALEQVPMPEGYDWHEEAGWQSLQQDMGELGRAGLLSLVLVYLLMAILLESMALPLSILLTVPLALIGVALTLFTFDIAQGPMVVVGLILLVGIVVNNAIVLLDHVQRLRGEGRSRRDALLQGGSDRIRPILMTALTTIFGLMPMAMPQFFPGSSGERTGYEPMAATVAGGLACSTFLTLFVVPLFYTFFDDLAQTARTLLPRRGAPVESEPRPAGTVHPALDRRDG